MIVGWMPSGVALDPKISTSAMMMCTRLRGRSIYRPPWPTNYWLLRSSLRYSVSSLVGSCIRGSCICRTARFDPASFDNEMILYRQTAIATLHTWLDTLSISTFPKQIASFPKTSYISMSTFRISEKRPIDPSAVEPPNY